MAEEQNLAERISEGATRRFGTAHPILVIALLITQSVAGVYLSNKSSEQNAVMSMQAAQMIGAQRNRVEDCIQNEINNFTGKRR